MPASFKFFAVFICVIGFSAAVHASPIRLSEPVQTDENSETFGAPIEHLPTGVALSALVNEPNSYLGKAISLKTNVAKVCQKKGCFFIAQQGGDIMRVAFKDYGFFVPTDIAGRDVILVGELTLRQVSPEMAQHFAKDLGESNALESGEMVEFVAESVRVEHTKTSD